MFNLYDRIDTELSAAIELPKLAVKQNEKVTYLRKMITPYLTSKHVKKISDEALQALLSREPDILLPEIRSFYASLPEKCENLTDYSNLKDGYEVSEYFCNYNCWCVDHNYLEAVKALKDGALINFYNTTRGTRFNLNFFTVQDEMKDMDFETNPYTECEFYRPDQINYTAFVKSAYSEKVLIETSCFPFPCLSVNLPYRCFAAQDIHQNLFTYDLDKKEFKLGKFSLSEANEILKEIALDGIKQPLFMRLDGTSLTTTNMKTWLIIFFAIYLKLPTIPVTLYLNDDNSFKDQYSAAHKIYTSKKIEWEKKNNESGYSKTKDRENIKVGYLNDTCKPYFLFSKTPTEGFIDIGSKVFNKQQYYSKTDPDSDLITYILDPTVEAPPPVIPQKELDKELDAETKLIHERNFKELRDKMNERIDQFSKNLFAHNGEKPSE